MVFLQIWVGVCVGVGMVDCDCSGSNGSRIAGGSFVACASTQWKYTDSCPTALQTIYSFEELDWKDFRPRDATSRKGNRVKFSLGRGGVIKYDLEELFRQSVSADLALAITN